MSFLLCFWAFFGMVNHMHVVWINDILDIRLTESVAQYEDLPQAILYVDGVEVTNPNVFYEKGVERTFLSTVNTNIVKTYEVKYRVTFSDYNMTQTHTILFNVIDDIPPTILSMKSFDVPVGGKMPNLLEGLMYQDNYDDASQMTVEVASHEVNLNVIGQYIITYTITDASFNQVTGQTTLRVFDHIPPEIKIKKAMIHPVNTPFNWTHYLTITDNYDRIITPVIDDKDVDYHVIGQYNITIYAYDQSLNQSTLHTTIEIIDTIAPVIKFKSNPSAISVHQEITRAFLESYILSVTDNYNILSFDDLMIAHDIDPSRLGEYRIYVTVYDESGNMGYAELKVKVIDDKRPEIALKAPLEFLVFEPKPHLMDYFIITDNYDAVEDIIIQISGTFNTNQVGSYLITVTATDQSKNKTVAYFHLYVIDQTPPTITLNQDIVITDFTPKPLELFFVVTDNYNAASDLKITIDDQKVSYHQVGIYQFTICAEDLSLNTHCEIYDVYIMDLEPPYLILTDEIITIDTTKLSIDYLAYVQAFGDDYDQLSIDDITIYSHITYGVIGLYKVIYSISDYTGNTHEETLHVRIDHHATLAFQTYDLKTQIHQHINLLSGLNIDDYGLEYSIYVESSHIDFGKAGTYEIIYIITDQRGNHYEAISTLTIESLPKKIDIQAYIPLIVLNILGLSAMGYFYRQRRVINVFDNDEDIGV